MAEYHETGSLYWISIKLTLITHRLHLFKDTYLFQLNPSVMIKDYCNKIWMNEQGDSNTPPTHSGIIIAI